MRRSITHLAALLTLVFGLNEQHDWVRANPQVIQAQLEIAKKWPHILVTSMIGLAKADGTHLTPAGLVEQGQRLHTNLRVLAPVGKLQPKARTAAKHRFFIVAFRSFPLAFPIITRNLRIPQ